MSFLIEDGDKFFFQFKGQHNQIKSPGLKEILGNGIDSTTILENLLKYIHPLSMQLVHTSSSAQSLTTRYCISNIYKNVSAIYTIHLNLATLTLKFEIKLLNSRNQYLQVEGNERNKLIFKYLAKKINHRDFKIQIYPTKGYVAFSFPFFYFTQELEAKIIIKYIDRMLKEFTRGLRQNAELIESILQLSGQKIYEIKSLYDQSQQKEKFIKNYEYRKLMNIQLCFASQAKENEAELNERLRKQIESIQRIKNGFFPTQKEFRSALLFFCSLTDHNHILQSRDNDLSIKGSTREDIRSKNQLPCLQKDKNNEDNPYILNYVLINKLHPNIKHKLINRGGFTNIYLTELLYWYVGSYWAGNFSDISSITSKTPVKKYVIIKRQNKELLVQGYRSRVAHEKYILKQIKNGFAIFLSKYYIDDKCTQLQNDLISDYIDYPNFQDYCIRHKESLSVQTKIYLSLMIAQSLRYLKEYKIVHLDLKPTNIMTSKRLTIKIIDFGESFHPNLMVDSQMAHSPGFSMPYSAPQNYRQTKGFSYKNDVFSLGVIMYQLFFGKIPFYFYTEELKQKVYSRGNYLDYLFFCPQEIRIAGQLMAFPLIQAIILKCLHPNPSQRPQLQWIVYLLRQCLNYLY